MKYALLVYADESSWESLDEREQQAAYAEYGAISALPNVLHDHQLQPAAETTTVRIGDDGPLLTEGPIDDHRVTLGGYYVLETADLDEALRIAARVPATRHGGAVEVRPVVER
jgi:hypothetical protein